MVFCILGGILIVLGIVLFFMRRSSMQQLAQVLATHTSTCAEAAKECREMAVQGPLKDIPRQLEVKGLTEGEDFLRGEISGRACVCYRCRVEREWKERVWRTGAKGRRYRQTRRGTDIVWENERLAPFHITDDSGRVMVDPDGADLDWVESVNDFRRGDSTDGALSIGGFAVNVAVGVVGGRQTVGYRYREWILPTGEEVYILGSTVVCDEMPCIGKSDEGGQPFIISRKSEEQLVDRTRSAIRWFTIGMGFCWALGGVLVAMGIGAIGR